MRKTVLLSALTLAFVFIHAQERNRASTVLRELKHGSLIVRLKTNQKSVDAYRKAGKENVARQIEEDRKDQNLKMYWAFKNQFKFCKVYFIYAHETMKLLNGEKGIFLNEKLEKDSTIIFSDTTFVICEYGSAQPFSDFKAGPFENQNAGRSSMAGSSESTLSRKDSLPIKNSTATATTSGLVLSDKNLQQMGRPFPYVVPVLGENYNAPVKALSRELERAYGRLVIRRDYNTKVKEMRKKQKEQWKSYKPAE